ncbi:MAG: HEAT repeat domain-containing protein [Pirellulales bacterium]
MLTDPNPEIRREAIRTLSSDANSARTYLPEFTAALRDSDSSIRVAAALAIQRFDPQNAAHQPILESALRAGQGPVFLEVGRAGRDAAWAVPTLLTLLDDRRPPIRALAAQTLGAIAPAEEHVRAALQRSLRDENAAVRNASRRALHPE